MACLVKTVRLLFACVAVCAFSMAAANASAQAPIQKTRATAKTAGESASPGKAATKATAHTSSEHKTKSHALASAEDLSGTISHVSPADRTLTLLGANGVPYDFQVTNKTQVELGDKQMAANELGNEDHQQATIRFVPTSRGNLAENIRISAS